MERMDEVGDALLSFTIRDVVFCVHKQRINNQQQL